MIFNREKNIIFDLKMSVGDYRQICVRSLTSLFAEPSRIAQLAETSPNTLSQFYTRPPICAVVCPTQTII